MLIMNSKEKSLGFITKDQMTKGGKWRLIRVPPSCEVCECDKGFKLIKKYYNPLSNIDAIYIIECRCCQDQTELEHDEYKQIKKVVALNKKYEDKKIEQMIYLQKLDKLLE
ncbi:MAG: hypothetical protein JEZ08_24080 [Clostridiales bacterium]|nr:hypothetical protein [Clostridiales bacterium]